MVPISICWDSVSLTFTDATHSPTSTCCADGEHKRTDFDVTFRQSNHEGDVVDWLQEARQEAAGVIINPGAFTHTSIAILDAIIATELPVIEVHISNIHAREEFRRHSYVSTVAKAVLCGFGIEGYGLAIDGLAALLGVKAQAA